MNKDPANKTYSNYFMQWQLVCEKNYSSFLQLLQVMEELKETDAHTLETQQGCSITRIKMLSHHSYTDCYQMSFLTQDWPSNLATPCLEIRLYHDLQIAEVYSADSLDNFLVNPQYPNFKMYLPDEKFQLNCLLREWIHFLLSNSPAHKV